MKENVIQHSSKEDVWGAIKIATRNVKINTVEKINKINERKANEGYRMSRRP